MAGRTRSSLPTDQRRRNTTIPGMAGGSAEAQRAWRSPPEKQRGRCSCLGHHGTQGHCILAKCVQQHRRLYSPRCPEASRLPEMLTHPCAGPTSVSSPPRANIEDLSSSTPSFGLTSEVSPAPKTGTGIWGLTLAWGYPSSSFSVP